MIIMYCCSTNSLDTFRSKTEEYQLSQWQIHKSIFKAAMKGDLTSVSGNQQSVFCTKHVHTLICITCPYHISVEEAA